MYKAACDFSTLIFGDASAFTQPILLVFEDALHLITAFRSHAMFLQAFLADAMPSSSLSTSPISLPTPITGQPGTIMSAMNRKWSSVSREWIAPSLLCATTADPTFALEEPVICQGNEPGPVDQCLHLCSHVREIDRGTQDDPVGSE